MTLWLILRGAHCSMQRFRESDSLNWFLYPTGVQETQIHVISSEGRCSALQGHGEDLLGILLLGNVREEIKTAISQESFVALRRL